MLNLAIFRLSAYKKAGYKFFLCLFVVGFFSSCATNVVSNSRQRAQEVFLYHNQLVSQLILISSDTTLSDQVAAKVRDGDKTSLGQRVNIPSTLSECERQTEAVEQLLAKF